MSSPSRTEAPGRARSSRSVLENGLPERRYRPDLHGVRGLALLGVVVFHLFGDGRISGGIDVFLAVSGFLFTGMLLREATASGGNVDPFKYFGRLVRRIVLPAALVIAATVAAGLLITPVTRHRQLWAEARASLLYFENFELINSQLAYGAAGPDTSPFQHFWSLSVQGQFYLVWPLVAILAVLVATRFRTSASRVMAVVVTIILLTSFFYAVYVGSYNQDEAYLMTATRAWQLAFGGLLALAGAALRPPRWLRGPAGWVGVGLIITCGLALDGAQLFPGPWSFWPLIGLTLVLIAAGPGGADKDPIWSATRFLSNRPLAWIGDRAYAIYLWHWPLLIFYMEARDRDAIGWHGALFILALTVVLAMLTHRYVEQPLQRAAKAPRPWRIGSNKAAVAMGTSLLVVGGLTATALTPPLADLQASHEGMDTDVYPGAAAYFRDDPLPTVEPFPDLAEASTYVPEYLRMGCSQQRGQDPGSDDITVCEDEHAPDSPTATIVLAGGSHAGHLEAAFRTLGRKYGWEVLVVTKSSCVFGWEEEDPNETMCGRWNDNFVEWLEHEDRVDLVVTPGTRLDQPEYVLDAAPYWWDKISQTGTDLMLVRGTPRKGGSTPDCLAEGGSPQDCGASKQHFAGTFPLLDMDLPDNVHPLDVTKYVCPQIENPEVEKCDAVVGNIVVWYDNHHFTTPFSQSLAAGFEAEMRDVVPHLVR